jgi:hypothetical protein
MKMGLDMYLFSAPKINGMELEEVLLASGRLSNLKEKKNEIYERVKPYIKHFEEYDSAWSSLLEEVTYWRKANQIHNWFVENIHNGIDEPCFTQEVTKENIQDLYSLCLKVLTNRTNPQDILPTRPGCFFGSTAYESFYYSEVEETKSILEVLLKNFNFETHYLMYQCSW